MKRKWNNVDLKEKTMELLMEATMLLDLELQPSRNLNLVFEHDKGYYSFLNGGEYIEGDIPKDLNARVINAKKAFINRYYNETIKAVYKAVRRSIDEVVIYVYHLRYIPRSFNYRWTVEGIICIDTSSQSNEFLVISSPSDDFLLEFSLPQLIRMTANDTLQEVCIDISEIIGSADGLYVSPLLDIYFDILELSKSSKEDVNCLSKDKKMELIKSELSNLTVTGEEFRKKWLNFFLFLDYVGKGYQSTVSKIIDDGYSLVIKDMLRGDSYNYGVDLLQVFSETGKFFNASDKFFKELSNYKWAHNRKSFNALRLCIIKLGEDIAISIVKSVDLSDSGDKVKELLIQYNYQTRIRKRA